MMAAHYPCPEEDGRSSEFTAAAQEGTRVPPQLAQLTRGDHRARYKKL